MRSMSLRKSDDLEKCAQESIQTPGSTQSHGTLFACDPETWRITHASANAEQIFGKRMSDVLGGNLKTLLGSNLAGTLATSDLITSGHALVPVRAFGVKIKGVNGTFDASSHIFDGRRIIEIESAAEKHKKAPLDLVRVMLAKLQEARTLKDLCDETVEQVRRLIGYDRVMVYRFLPDGSGQVIAESRLPSLEPLLNLRYPASDVPQQARDLYKKNWVRVISDVASMPVPILGLDEASRPLDLSHADLRSVSPIHIEYLKNMGVGASMSISIIAGGELWGLIACHAKEGRPLSANLRAAAELLGQVVSLQIQTVEGIEAYVTMRSARAQLDRLVAEFPVRGDLVTNLASRLEEFAAFIPCDGAGIWLDGAYRGIGETPDANEIPPLAAMIEARRDSEIYATHHLIEAFPAAKSWAAPLRGVLAVPLSYSGGDYLFFFRKELSQTIEWGGDPSKPLTFGKEGRISPRKSFEAWKQHVRGQSMPWSSRERLIGDTLRVFLLDMVVRFAEALREERREAQLRNRMLASELNTRVKGTLDLIQSLVVHGYEEPGQVQDFVRALENRIRAIALAHDATSVASGSEIRPLVEQAFALHNVPASKLQLGGPAIKLDAKSFTVLALVVHELVAGSVDGGALSEAKGRVRVMWTISDSGDAILRWEEQGRDANLNAHDGLGLAILNRNIPVALGGMAEVHSEGSAFSATFTIPARFVSEGVSISSDDDDAEQAALPPDRPLEGCSILIVEDDMPAAIELEGLLYERGAESIRIGTSAFDAVALLSMSIPDVAILDVDLGTETSLSIASVLAEQAIPFVFAASDADRTVIDPSFREVAILPKPYAPDGLSAVIKDAMLPEVIRSVLANLS